MAKQTHLQQTAPGLRWGPQGRLFTMAYVLLTLLSLAGCATPSQQTCFWPQSWASGCQEIMEVPGK